MNPQENKSGAAVPQPTSWKENILALAAEAGRENDLIAAIETELAKAREEQEKIKQEERQKAAAHIGLWKNQYQNEGRQQAITEYKKKVLAALDAYKCGEHKKLRKLITDL